MKILIIEDEDSIRRVLRKGLENRCFTVDTASDGERGSFLGRTEKYDLILLDNILPKKHAINVCQEIREERPHVPILILSAKSESTEKVNLINSGADDYITKPFSFEELLARIQALLRRPRHIEVEKLTAGTIELDSRSQEVQQNSKKIYLTKKEYTLLEYLMRKKGTVVSRTDILEKVWDLDTDPFSNTIETHIRNVRLKLGDVSKKIIKNIPGRGYVLRP